MNEMIKTIKEIHRNDLCMFKIGSFYHCYNRDAYILSYIFGYKIKSIEKSNKECGFPISAIEKIIAKLEILKINYVLIDRRDNYDIDEKKDYKKLNEYENFYERANIYLNYKTRIDNINSFLLENMNKKDFRKILGKIEDIIYERREV